MTEKRKMLRLSVIVLVYILSSDLEASEDTAWIYPLKQDPLGGPNVCNPESTRPCCEGWIQEYRHGPCAKPICTPGCLGGLCIAPNLCQCRDGRITSRCDKEPPEQTDHHRCALSGAQQGQASCGLIDLIQTAPCGSSDIGCGSYLPPGKTMSNHHPCAGFRCLLRTGSRGTGQQKPKLLRRMTQNQQVNQRSTRRNDRMTKRQQYDNTLPNQKGNHLLRHKPHGGSRHSSSTLENNKDAEVTQNRNKNSHSSSTMETNRNAEVTQNRKQNSHRQGLRRVLPHHSAVSNNAQDTNKFDKVSKHGRDTRNDRAWAYLRSYRRKHSRNNQAAQATNSLDSQKLTSSPRNNVQIPDQTSIRKVHTETDHSAQNHFSERITRPHQSQNAHKETLKPPITARIPLSKDSENRHLSHLKKTQSAKVSRSMDQKEQQANHGSIGQRSNDKSELDSREKSFIESNSQQKDSYQSGNRLPTQKQYNKVDGGDSNQRDSTGISSLNHNSRDAKSSSRPFNAKYIPGSSSRQAKFLRNLQPQKTAGYSNPCIRGTECNPTDSVNTQRNCRTSSRMCTMIPKHRIIQAISSPCRGGRCSSNPNGGIHGYNRIRPFWRCVMPFCDIRNPFINLKGVRNNGLAPGRICPDGRNPNCGIIIPALRCPESDCGPLPPPPLLMPTGCGQIGGCNGVISLCGGVGPCTEQTDEVVEDNPCSEGQIFVEHSNGFRTCEDQQKFIEENLQ